MFALSANRWARTDSEPNSTKGCIDYISHPQYVGLGWPLPHHPAPSLLVLQTRQRSINHIICLHFSLEVDDPQILRPDRAYLTPSYPMDPDASGGWRFAQCFGDKGDVEDITEGNETFSSCLLRVLRMSPPAPLRPRPLRDARSTVSAVSLTYSKSGQPISFPPSSLILVETTSQRVTRAVVWCYSSEMTWCVLCPLSPLWPLCRRLLMPPSHSSVELAPLDSTRKKAANTNFTPSSSRTNQSLTTSSHSRLRRRSTRFGGVNDRILHISYYQRMVRPRPINGIVYGQPLICAFCVAPRRQDD